MLTLLISIVEIVARDGGAPSGLHGYKFHFVKAFSIR